MTTTPKGQQAEAMTFRTLLERAAEMLERTYAAVEWPATPDCAENALAREIRAALASPAAPVVDQSHLLKAAEHLRDDLRRRLRMDYRNAVKVVPDSNGAWIGFCNAIDAARSQPNDR